MPDYQAFYVFYPAETWPRHAYVLETIERGVNRLSNNANPAVNTIYSDTLYSEWKTDWSWHTSFDLTNVFVGSSGISSGTGRRSIYVNHYKSGGALRLRTETGFSTYASALTFKIFGDYGGVFLQLRRNDNSKTQHHNILSGTVTNLPSGFKQVEIPLSKFYDGVWDSILFQALDDTRIG
eukprot:5358-Prorocentrum_minimum.AAC.1